MPRTELNESTTLDSFMVAVCEGYTNGTYKIDLPLPDFQTVSAIALIYGLLQENRNNFEAIAEEICARIEKVIHRALFEENQAELKALQDGIRNFKTNQNTELLDELELKSLDLFRKFEDDDTLEGLTCAITAASSHMSILQACYNRSANDKNFLKYKETILMKSVEFADFFDSKLNFVRETMESSIDSCAISQDLRCVLDPESSFCDLNKKGKIEYSGSIQDRFNDKLLYQVPLNERIQGTALEDQGGQKNVEQLKRKYVNIYQQECESLRNQLITPRKEFGAHLVNNMMSTASFFRHQIPLLFQ